MQYKLTLTATGYSVSLSNAGAQGISAFTAASAAGFTGTEAEYNQLASTLPTVAASAAHALDVSTTNKNEAIAANISATAAASAAHNSRVNAEQSHQNANTAASTAVTAKNAAELAASAVPAIEAQTSALGRMAAWQSETQAEAMRGGGQSGLYAIRQYEYGGHAAYDRSFTENFNPASTHNHPNYDITPGTAEFAVVINGYYLRTRHNDYMLKRPAPVGSNFLDLQKVEPPPLPPTVLQATTVNAQITAMRDVFKRYSEGQWPEGFGWTMSYVEVWFEPFSEVFQDTFDSFRHQQRITDLDTAFQEITRYNASGYKDRNENVPFEPALVRWVENGKPVLARMRYRIAAVDVSSLGDLRPHLTLIQDLAYRHGFDRDSVRYKVNENKNWAGTLDALMRLVPGLDGTGANLTESYADYGVETVIKGLDSSTPLNAAYYSRFATSVADASNRAVFRRGFNDPSLFVASTTRSQVLPMTIDGKVYRFSYAVPFELILRTPLEHWNPFNLPFNENVTGAGTLASPYSGWRDRDYNYKVPSAFYSGGTPGDVADTGMADAWVTSNDGLAYSVKGSGIYIHLPEIKDIGNIRLRHHIYPVYQEGSHAHAQHEALRREQTTALASMASDLVRMQTTAIKSLDI